MSNRKIIMLAFNGESTHVVYNHLQKQFGISHVIIEDKESFKLFIKRRIKKLGIITVLGQIAFQIMVSKPLNYLSKKRQRAIFNEFELDSTLIPKEKTIRVASVNASETIDLINQIKPDLIIVHGTRIISKKVLKAANCKMINMHAGITPKYRGVHGSYWALRNEDTANNGVTVHFVDEGIDTGQIISQCLVNPTPKDNFSTYPLLQLAAGLNMLVKAMDAYFNNSLLMQKEKTTESHLWYHPTIWSYCYGRFIKGVK